MRVEAAERIGNAEITNHLVHNNSYGPRNLQPASRLRDPNAGSSDDTVPPATPAPEPKPVPPQPPTHVEPQQSTGTPANPASGNGAPGGNEKPKVGLVLGEVEQKRRKKILAYVKYMHMFPCSMFKFMGWKENRGGDGHWFLSSFSIKYILFQKCHLSQR